MPDDIDKSLLDRLHALRGTSAPPEQATPTKPSIDLLERKRTPTREDTLAARLKSLREASDSPTRASPPAPGAKASGQKAPPIDDEEDDSIFETDDTTLEELLGDVAADEGFAADPDEAKVKALLEELSNSVPQDEEKDRDSDDSDGEDMTREVDQVVAKFRDEAEVDAALKKDEPDQDDDDDSKTSQSDADLALPTVPSDLQDLPATPSARAGSADLDDITARMAALRADDDGLSLPSVPTSRPAGKPINRLTTKTGYTDDDMDGWCTVCLEDATLRCLGCDDDVYCTRCWREMHIGPSAGFDERSHRAVQFTKDKKKEKKVALGA